MQIGHSSQRIDELWVVCVIHVHDVSLLIIYSSNSMGGQAIHCVKMVSKCMINWKQTLVIKYKYLNPCWITLAGFDASQTICCNFCTRLSESEKINHKCELPSSIFNKISTEKEKWILRVFFYYYFQYYLVTSADSLKLYSAVPTDK